MIRRAETNLMFLFKNKLIVVSLLLILTSTRWNEEHGIFAILLYHKMHSFFIFNLSCENVTKIEQRIPLPRFP